MLIIPIRPRMSCRRLAYLPRWKSGMMRIPDDVAAFEKLMRKRVHYVIHAQIPLGPHRPSWPAPTSKEN